MATFSNSLAALRPRHDVPVDADEELRVLTALLGCIMVAEDAGGQSDHRSSIHHLSPPVRTEGLAKAV
ncbi:hypothetical protein [Rhodopseudomonas sp.]|uniref:hypothetical protein n=1 Tax=Rhodopseudomonas sp. TaxID=1078 RepID=UPI003B3BC3B6